MPSGRTSVGTYGAPAAASPRCPAARACAKSRNAQSRPCSTCASPRVGEITVATLHNAPIVPLFANGAPVTLLLDTGAEWTILTPAAAKRIGAQTPRIEFQRQPRGIAGTLATNEVELRSFTAG